MDANFVYNFNVENSEEFRAFDQYYQFLEEGQDINWDNWWNYSKNVWSAKEILRKQKEIRKYFAGKVNSRLYISSVDSTGRILGNPLSFLANYRSGRTFDFDII